MSKKYHEFINELKRMYQHASRASELWQEVDHTGDYFNDKYPFESSFDEVCIDLQEWIKKVIFLPEPVEQKTYAVNVKVEHHGVVYVKAPCRQDIDKKRVSTLLHDLNTADFSEYKVAEVLHINQAMGINEEKEGMLCEF